MSEPQNFEVRTDDNRLFCMARLIEGDILLILKFLQDFYISVVGENCARND